MKSKVDYTSLTKAGVVLSSISSSNILSAFTASLEELTEKMSVYTTEHDCFPGDVEAIMNLQTGVLNRDIEVANLSIAIQLVISTFLAVEGNISQLAYQELEALLMNCFSVSSGILPFQYHEIEEFNKANKADFRIQGYTIADGYYLITAYDHNNKYNSRVYIYDKKGKNIGFIELQADQDKKAHEGKNIGFIELQADQDKKAHVGGVTYDSKHNILLITGIGGVVNSYNFDTITKSLSRATDFYGTPQKLSSSADLSIIEKGSINISEHIQGGTSAATTYYSSSDNTLYVADCAGAGTLVKYNVSYGRDGQVKYDGGKVVSDEFASCCQGIATYKDPSGKQYIYASQSYGDAHSSVLKKYEITSSGTKELGATIIDTPGLEGIQIDPAGNVSGVFENFNKVKNPNQTLNINVNTTDFSTPLKELDPSLEQFYQKKGISNKEKLNYQRRY